MYIPQGSYSREDNICGVLDNVHPLETLVASHNWCDMTVLAFHVSARTNKYNVVVPNVRSNYGRKSMSYRGPYFWNTLSNNLKNLVKFNTFVHAWIEYCKVNFENHPT